MNNKVLKQKVNTAMYELIKEKGIASPVEVLIAIGVLSKVDYERWRRGQIDYLERVCKINLGKLSTINREIRVYAQKNNLKPSWTFYKQWGKGKTRGKRILLRFSKYGNENIEKLYATHYVSQVKVAEGKAKRELKKEQKKAKESDE